MHRCWYQPAAMLKCDKSHSADVCIKSCALVQGLRVKMITGDQALIGRETAKQLGMGHNIFNTEVLLKVTVPLPIVTLCKFLQPESSVWLLVTF